MRKHRVPLVGSIACIFLAMGCVISDNPWFTDKDVVFDPGLVGSWVGTKDANQSLVLEKGAGNSYAIKDDKESTPVHLFKIGEAHYLDLKFKDSKKEKSTSGHMVLKVVRDGDNLTLTHMDSEFVAKGIDAKTLDVKGTVERKEKKNPPKVHLTGPTSEVRALLEKHGAELFKSGQTIQFKRKGK